MEKMPKVNQFHNRSTQINSVSFEFQYPTSEIHDKSNKKDQQSNISNQKQLYSTQLTVSDQMHSTVSEKFDNHSSFVNKSSKTVQRKKKWKNKGSLQNQSVNFKQLGNQDVFECGKCRENMPLCTLCQNSNTLKGNSNFSNFFTYILEYKLGKKKNNYKNSPSLFKSSQTNINEHCQLFYSSKDFTLSKQSLDSKSSIIHTLYEKKLTHEKTIHTDYNCDLCGVSPIQGTRYHCSHPDCGDDFDICGQCYYISGHQHSDRVDEIRQNEVYSSRSKIVNKVEGCLNRRQRKPMLQEKYSMKQNKRGYKYQNQSIRSNKI